MPYFAENRPNEKGEYEVGYYDERAEYVLCSTLTQGKAEWLAEQMNGQEEE